MLLVSGRMNAAARQVDRRGTLRHLRGAVDRAGAASDGTEGAGAHGLDAPVALDLAGAAAAREEIRLRPFVTDAHEPAFAGVQLWIEQAGADVRLPLNFCGGLLIMRFYRLITPASEQTPRWMKAVYDAAAAYDFAFLALGHADDEADGTLARDGYPTRFVTHPDTRAVDGVNLLLAGVTAMQARLDAWPHRAGTGASRHPLAGEVLEAFVRALREASFPILLDRTGLGHTSGETRTASGMAPLVIDALSLRRLEAFSRHRAQTYFMRAIDIAARLASYEAIAPDLQDGLDEIFGLLGLLGAATDDIQDLVLDFPAGIHSACTVMAHLCVADDPALRPAFRRDLADDVVRDQARRLSGFFGVTVRGVDRTVLLRLLEEIELRKALTAEYEVPGARLTRVTHGVATQYGFSPKLLMELVSVVSRNPEFEVPEMVLTALESPVDEDVLDLVTAQAGAFIAQYLVDRFWPAAAGPE